MADARQPSPRRVLLVQLRRAGDIVVSTALLEDLHDAFPGVVCDWLGGPAATLLEHHPLIERLLVHDHRDVVGMGRAARAGEYDCVLDVQGSWRTAVATAASGAALRVGWRGWNRGWAYTHAVRRAPAGSRTYVVTDRRRLLQAIGVKPEGGTPRLYLTTDERERGRQRVREVAGDPPVAGIVLSTSDRVKDWPAARFAELASALEADGVAAVVFSTPDSGAHETEYRRIAGDAARVLRVSQLRELMELINACDVFVSGDTGPAHIATALGVPRVTVYGPTQAEGWTPPGGDAVAVRDGAARCLSCAGRAPASRHTCLETVTARMVLPPLRELLAHRTRRDT